MPLNKLLYLIYHDVIMFHKYKILNEPYNNEYKHFCLVIDQNAEFSPNSEQINKAHHYFVWPD